MPSPNPACTVADGGGAAQTTPPYAAVTPGNTVTIALADTTGVTTWSITCVACDETTTAATITASLTVNAVTKTATFTAPASGKAMIFQSRVNDGVLGGISQATYTTTFKVATLTSNGLAVSAVNEGTEHNATSGWAGVVNAAVRTSSFGYHHPTAAATIAALPANTRVGNVLTANANGALAAQDGVTLAVTKRLLVKDEVTTANNGIFDVTSMGAGGAPWILTRSTDADESVKAPGGFIVPVSGGTVNGNSVFQLQTDDPVTLNTTGLTFAKISGASTRRSNPYGGTVAAYWRLDEAHTAGSFSGTLVNSGTGGAATLAATEGVGGGTFAATSSQGSVLGTGEVAISGVGAGNSFLAVTSAITAGTATFFAACWFMVRRYPGGNAIAFGRKNGTTTTFAIGLGATGIPYFSINTSGGGLLTVAADMAIPQGTPVFIAGYLSGGFARIYRGGMEAGAALGGGTAGNIAWATGGGTTQFCMFNDAATPTVNATLNGQVSECWISDTIPTDLVAIALKGHGYAALAA